MFTLRRTKIVGIKSWKSEMQALRAMEMVCDVSNRRINDKNRVAAKRANETERDRADSRMSDRKSKMAKRAEESEQQRADRRMSNKKSMMAKRAEETEQQKAKRRMSNKLSMMTKRAEETEQQKAVRRNIDKANKRAKESDSTKEVHKIRNIKAMASKRASSVSLETAIADFLSKVQYGPDHVSMSCYRMMYSKSVIDTLLAVKYVAGAVLLSQLVKFLNLVTHNESVHCGISFEIFLPVHSQTKFLFCHKFGFTCCTIASISIFFGCLSFVVVVVVFHSSKFCIQLLPFLCGFVFVAHHNKSHVHFVNYTTIILL